MEHSKGSHYKWGWNGEWHNDPVVNGKFQLAIGSCVNGHMSFRAECISAVNQLANQLTKPILVGLSGGSDSQVACLALREAKVPFTPVIVKLLGPQGGVRNEHDITGAYEFCKLFGLTPRVETLYLREFFRGRGLELAREHCLTNSNTVVQLAMIERVKATHSFIMAGGDVVITKLNGEKRDPTTPLISPFGPTPIQQHLIKYNIEGCTKLFMYTPELIASYLNNDIIRGFLVGHKSIYAAFFEAHRDPAWTCFNYYVKPLFYHAQWPELISRKKYTGFERADDLVTEAEVLMNLETERFRPYANTVRIPIIELLEHVISGKGSSKIWTA